MNKYDNKFTEAVVSIVGTLVRTIERSIVLFWDGLRSATEHGTPSLLGFVSAILPVLMPLPVVGMTAYSLKVFFGWEDWQVFSMSAGLEGAGFVLWVTLTETLIKDGWKGSTMQFFFGVAVLVYQTLLVIINGVLSAQEGKSDSYVWTLILLSFLPALSAIAYAYRNYNNTAKLEQEAQEEKALAEKIRQEKRQDRKENQRLKLTHQFNSDTEGLRMEDRQNGKSFRK